MKLRKVKRILENRRHAHDAIIIRLSKNPNFNPASWTKPGSMNSKRS